MPELPEVETVRRGLQPVMEGARFLKVIAHRGDLRWPLGQDFAARLEGKTVEGLGRRAKYLLADLSSGEVLVMHLGMSGSFRVAHRRGKAMPGRYYHERARRVPHVLGRAHFLQRSATLRHDEARPPRRARPRAAAACARSRAAGQPIRRGDAGTCVQGQEDLAQGRAVGPENRRGARQHLCVRSAPPRSALAQAPRLHDCDQGGGAERARATAGRCHQGGACGGDRGRRLIAARSSPHRRRARRFSAQFSRL